MAVFGRLNAILLFCALAAAAQPSPTADQWLPEGAVYAFRVEQPGALLDLAASLKIPEMLLANPTDPGFQRLVEMLSKRAGTDYTGLIRQFTGGGVTYVLYPGDASVIVFDTQNPQLLDVLQQFVKAVAGTPVVSPASAKKPSIFYQEYPGDVVVWSLDGKQVFARTGNRLILTNQGETMKVLFAPRAHGSLAASPLYAQARQAAGAHPAAWGFINMAMLNRYPPAQKALANNDLFDIVFNGPLKQSLRGANWVSLGLSIEGRKLRLHAATDGKLDATGFGAIALPAEPGILPNLSVPRELAAATFWRDLGQFYGLKDTLFPEKTSGGILAENFLEIFFTGRDLNQEVFSRLEPQVRLIVARQQYDPKIGTPVEQYPAAALVFRVKPAPDKEDFGEVLEEAWQKAVGLTNFTRGQQALPGVLLDRETYGGVTFTYGAFSTRSQKDRAHLPSNFNYRPAIVRDGPYIILSTTDGLARDLIDAVNHEDSRQPARQSDTHTLVEVNSPAEIAALLNVNRSGMIRQSVLSKGQKPEQAALEFDRNVAWLDKLARARLSMTGNQADLDLELK
jgi:hypothetical protein